MNRTLLRLSPPLILAGLFLTLGLATGLLAGEPPSSTLPLPAKLPFFIVHIGLWLSSAYLLIALVNRFVWEGVVESSLSRPVPRLLKDSGAVVIYMIAGTGIIGVVFQQSVTGVVTTSGIIGVVLGLALQNMIQDLFMGLAINLEGSFRIGDWVRLHDNVQADDDVGRLAEVNWRTSRLVTTDNVELVVPNRLLGNMVVTNYMRPSSRSRFRINIYLDPLIPVERAKRVLQAAAFMAQTQHGFYPGKPPSARVRSFGKEGVRYEIKYWIEPAKISPAKALDKINTFVLDYIRQAGLSTALLERTLEMQEPAPRIERVRSIEARRRLVNQVPFFAGLEKSELETLASAMIYRPFSWGEEVIRAGDEGSSMFILMEGLLSVSISSGEDEVEVAKIQPGSFFGEMSLLTGEPRSATIRAATEVVIYEITKETLSAILAVRPALLETISSVIAHRKMHNDQALQDASAEEQARRVDGFSRQILGKMKSFFQGVFS